MGFEPLSIAPTPNIFSATDSEPKFKRILGPMRCIPLTIAAHRGHYGDIQHPKHLLVNDAKGVYYSKEGDPNGDWIVFEVTEDTHFVIAQIRIRNDTGRFGIKEIALSLGDRESVRNGQWTEWQRIADIHKENDDIQCFDVEPNLKQKAFEYVKLKIVKNHGDNYYNIFHHFSVFGFEFV